MFCNIEFPTSVTLNFDSPEQQQQQLKICYRMTVIHCDAKCRYNLIIEYKKKEIRLLLYKKERLSSISGSGWITISGTMCQCDCALSPISIENQMKMFARNQNYCPHHKKKAKNIRLGDGVN